MLSKAGRDVTACCPAFMQAQRYWVKRTLQDAKTEAGLVDYQGRGWKPRHRHMAMVSMAMALSAGGAAQPGRRLVPLSCRGVTAVLKRAIRSRQMTPEAIIRRIENRHRLPEVAIRSAEEPQRAADIFNRPAVTKWE